MMNAVTNTETTTTALDDALAKIDDALALHARVDGRCAVCVTTREDFDADGSLNTSVDQAVWPCETAEALGATRD